MGFWGFIIGFHKQTKIIKDEETKNFKQTLSSYNGVMKITILFSRVRILHEEGFRVESLTCK